MKKFLSFLLTSVVVAGTVWAAESAFNSLAPKDDADNNTKYPIFVKDGIENGTVTVNPTEAAIAETVTITLSPAEGYELDELKVEVGTNRTISSYTFFSASGTIETTKDADNDSIYTFVLPADGELPHGNSSGGSIPGTSSNDSTYNENTAFRVSATFKKEGSLGETYKVVVAEVENGSATVDPTEAAKGQTVTITAHPNHGYTLLLDSVLVEQIIDLSSMMGGGDSTGTGTGTGTGGGIPGMDSMVFVQDTIAVEQVNDTVFTFVIPEDISSDLGGIGGGTGTGTGSFDMTPQFRVTPKISALPPSLWVIGEVNEVGWHTNTGLEMQYHAGSGQYEVEITANNATSFFAIVKNLTENDGEWDTLNADGNRLCGETEADNFEITSLNQDGIALMNSTKGFQIPAGSYKLIINEEMDLLKVEGDLPIILVDMYMIGSFNQWNTNAKVPMEFVDGKYVLTMEMGTGNASEFKLMDVNNKWYGAESDENFLISQEMVNAPEAFITILKDGGKNMYFDVAGEYTFTYDPYERKLYVNPTTPVGLTGDANGDGNVDVSDVTTVINYILQRNPDPFSYDNANVNGDDVVNVQDVTLIINIILNLQ